MQQQSFPGHSAEEILDAWDAVRARRERPAPSQIIDSQPIGFWRAYRARWATAPLHIRLIAIFLGCYVLPWAILIGGLALLVLYDAIIGH